MENVSPKSLPKKDSPKKASPKRDSPKKDSPKKIKERASTRSKATDNDDNTSAKSGSLTRRQAKEASKIDQAAKKSKKGVQ